MENISKILKNHITEIKPDSKVLKKIEIISSKFCKELENKIKKKNIDAEVFIGGSIAKETLIKKDKYDIDVFVRFGTKHLKISDLLETLLDKDFKKIHGSRDYYQKDFEEIILEVIPVRKISKIENAENITDLSYFHVNYVKKEIRKNKKLSDEIRLAKSFCAIQDCYGAEGYIRGFSGYSLELLIIYYGSFLKFIKEISKSKEKIIIDSERYFKNKNLILRELNESKTQSPIILIDPTCKNRNALAGLSNETFQKFQKICCEFLKKPSQDFFKRKILRKELKEKYKDKLKIISIKTTKQKGDIAGTKSRKFFDFFIFSLKKEFIVKLSEFEYNENGNLAYFYLIVEKKLSEIIRGPWVINVEHLSRFKKNHENAFIKDSRAYAKIKHELKFEDFVKKMQKNKNILEQMSIKEIKIMN
jgi:tRNA nucleotidyltransferase (CCA-adding enzyme)